MKAIVFHDVGDIRLDDVSEPKIKNPHEAIVRLTANAICGTDLHMVRGTMTGMVSGTILGHEGVGVVAEVGPEVRNFKKGDRVVLPSTIGCGSCAYCLSGYYAQCDRANPNGPSAGTAFYGGPKTSGPFNGMQAEFVLVPYAHTNMVKLPDAVDDDAAIMMSDIFPTGYFGAENAEIKPGDTVAVFGCGPVGQFAIASAWLKDAGRVFAIDCVPARLEMARAQGAEVINFNEEDPVETIKELTFGVGADRIIDAVGVDAMPATGGPAAKQSKALSEEFEREVNIIAPIQHPEGDNWHPGEAPGQALLWAVTAIAKAGTLSIIGVYPETMQAFPLGNAMEKNLTIKMGNCNHRRYIPELIRLVQSNQIDPRTIITQREPLLSAIAAYKTFDERMHGWVKVELKPLAA